MIESNKLGKYLDILQIFRGLAAILVVFHHSIGSIKYYHNINLLWLDLLQSIGKYGVDFFFILSGFIISYTAYFKKNHTNAFSSYIKNRLIRIYVPYLPLGIFMFCHYVYFPSFSNSSREISPITSFTLMPHGNPALSVAWTLTYEVIFYILFSVYFFSEKLMQVLFFSWSCLIIYFNWLTDLILIDLPIIKHLLSAYNLEFILGILLSYSILIKFRLNIYLVVFLSIMICCLFFISITYNYNEQLYFSQNILFSFFCFLLIYFSLRIRIIK